MSFEAQCPQCRFVSQQLGQPTPCLLHVALEPELSREPAAVAANQSSAANESLAEDYDEPYAFGQLRLSVDRPGPFTLREYVRLQLLRTRVQAELSSR